MKAMLSRLASRKEIGLAISETGVAACVMAVLPFGRIELARLRVPCEPDQLPRAIEELLAGCTTAEDRARCQVILGLPAIRVFFSTRPIQPEHLGASSAALLHEVIQSPTLNIDDMVVDMTKHRLGQRTLACIVSGRKRYVNAVLAALQASGLHPTRTEPSPCALLRHATRIHPAPRRARSFVRIFLGQEQGLAVLVTDGEVPLIWRPFVLTPCSEAEAILAAVASVRSPGVYCGLESDVDAILVHGRPDLGPLAELAASPTLKDVRAIRHDRPGLDEEAVAHGLSLKPSLKIEPFNLVRTFAGVVKFRDIFPLGQTLVHALVLASATFFLQHRLQGHEATAAAAAARDAKHKWAAGQATEKLNVEKKALELRVESIRSFLATRTIWTNYSRDLTGQLTTDLALISISGVNELESPGSKGVKPKHQMIVGLNSPIPKTGAMPKEIDGFLRTLRDDPLLKKEFPNVELADLRWTQASGRPPTATFNVVCMPLKSAPPKPAAPKAKGK